MVNAHSNIAFIAGGSKKAYHAGGGSRLQEHEFYLLVQSTNAGIFLRI